ncbi:MAG: ABC transporter ATP-binding protein [Candidatus Nanopelagicales bacterium]
MTSQVAPAIRMRDVAVSRGGRTIWSGATMDVPQGSFTAVIGPNGAGKSTTAALLLGTLAPSNGTLEVLGEKPHKGNPKIGFVPQNHTLAQAGTISCRDVVGLGVVGTRWGVGIRSKNVRKQVAEALEAVDATKFADARFGNISGGQQQRVSIAQALITNPEMLVLDEPLSGLDLHGQVEIVELVHKINHDLGVTVLFVTHDLNPLLAHIDSIYYIYDGVAHYGSRDDVVTAEMLTKMYGTPVQVTRTDDGCIYTRTD